MGIRHRAVSGAHEKTPWMFLGIGHRDDLLRRHIAQKDALRLEGLNRGRVLAVRIRHLDAHKRLKMAIIKEDIPRIRTALAVQTENGAGIFGLLRTVDRAAIEVYKPKLYQMSEYQRTYLFWKLGGVFAANLGHRTMGLPSIDSARRHVATEPMRVSPGRPTVIEMESNLRIGFKSWKPPVHERKVIRYAASLPIDEIKVQERLRWEAATNLIIGLCREHCPAFALEFRSMQQADHILEGLRSEPQRVHLAAEVRTT